jgi:hypothetical protein
MLAIKTARQKERWNADVTGVAHVTSAFEENFKS